MLACRGGTYCLVSGQSSPVRLTAGLLQNALSADTCMFVLSAEVLTDALSAPSSRRGSEGVPGSPFTPQTYALVISLCTAVYHPAIYVSLYYKGAGLRICISYCITVCYVGICI